jgi:hypothetical protein
MKKLLKFGMKTRHIIWQWAINIIDDIIYY